jgi:membrane protease YdiL (CAAX protease family)
MSIREFNNFFKEWKDSEQMVQLGALSIVILTLVSLWISVNITEYQNIGFFFFGMLVIVGMVGFADYLKESNRVGGSAAFGKNSMALMTGLFGGAVLGVFLSVTMAFSIPFAAAGLYSFLFVVILAPLVEEYFFRGTVFFTLLQTGKSIFSEKYLTIVSIVITSVVFGVFHFTAYGASVPLMFTAMIFSVIAITGNAFFKTTGFGLGLHLMVNFVAWNIMVAGLM